MDANKANNFRGFHVHCHTCGACVDAPSKKEIAAALAETGFAFLPGWEYAVLCTDCVAAYTAKVRLRCQNN